MESRIFLEKLQSFCNPKQATLSKQYHKSSREHWGISLPICEKVTRSFSKNLTNEELIELATDLWDTNLFDPMMCAAKIVGLLQLKPSKLLWETILYFLQRVDGWALEDSLCQAAWKCILADLSRLEQVEEWTHSQSFWIRRAALVYTLPLAKPGRDPERSLRWASGYASDAEWFIQKAIGWWLRVLGEHNPQRVYLFLKVHWQQLKGVARKEATRKLSPEWQEKMTPFFSKRLKESHC